MFSDFLAPLFAPLSVRFSELDGMKLPWIHDTNAFLHSTFILEDTMLRSKVEAIIKFILTPEYQKLPWWYGVIRHESGRYYAMGWSVHLPGYFESRTPIQYSRRLHCCLNCWLGQELLGNMLGMNVHWRCSDSSSAKTVWPVFLGLSYLRRELVAGS